jgi:hypothetical protein
MEACFEERVRRVELPTHPCSVFLYAESRRADSESGSQAHARARASRAQEGWVLFPQSINKIEMTCVLLTL